MEEELTEELKELILSQDQQDVPDHKPEDRNGDA